MQGVDSVFRVLEIGRQGGRYAAESVATGFLVSEQGYALTPWHAFDYDLKRRRFTARRKGSRLRIAPRWADPNDQGCWESPVIVGEWSDPEQDVAVLALEPPLVAGFKLTPMPLCMDLRPSLPVVAFGFNRATQLKDANPVAGRLLDQSDLLRRIHNPRVPDQRLIEVLFADIPFEEGMSGGPLMPTNSRVAIGMQTASDLPRRGVRLSAACNNAQPE